MITATCRWCGQTYSARTVAQRFCSKPCAGLHQWRDHPRRAPSNWGKRPSLGSDHRQLRARLLPAALGTPCPLRISPHCTDTLDDTAQLDHILARAHDGPTTEDNCRIICAPCNQLRGAQLGGHTAHQRARTSTVTPTVPPRPRLPRW